MVLEISQETFNNAVRENVELLDLTQEEAVDEAVKQFEAQVYFQSPFFPPTDIKNFHKIYKFQIISKLFAGRKLEQHH